MASGKNFLMIEELNSDAGEPQMLRDFPLSNTVKDLKMAIARMIDETADWQTIMAIFVGEEMEDSECKTLANYLACGHRFPFGEKGLLTMLGPTVSKPLSTYRVQNVRDSTPSDPKALEATKDPC